MKVSDQIQAGLFVDGQLNRDEIPKTVQAMHEDPELQREVDEIQELKTLMKQAYPLEDERGKNVSGQDRRTLRWVASAAAIVLAFVLGLMFPTKDMPGKHKPISVVANDAAAPVILHIPDRNPDNWSEALDIAEAFANRHVKVELLANSTGLDLLSATRSPYAARIQALAKKYPELAFIACSSGLQKLREQGIDARLLDGVSTAPSAVEHVAEKVSQGWQYIKL